MTATDILTDIDRAASVSLTTAGEIRDLWLVAAACINFRDGHFDSGRIRTWLNERGYDWAHGSESGAAITGLVRSGQVVDTGERAPLGNTAQRAGTREVKVYRFLDAGERVA